MALNDKLIAQERRAAIAMIKAHRASLGSGRLDREDFDELKHALTDALLTLRVFAASVELDFEDSLEKSKGSYRNLVEGKV
jgi:hypothetical protein